MYVVILFSTVCWGTVVWVVVATLISSSAASAAGWSGVSVVAVGVVAVSVAVVVGVGIVVVNGFFGWRFPCNVFGVCVGWVGWGVVLCVGPCVAGGGRSVGRRSSPGVF